MITEEVFKYRFDADTDAATAKVRQYTEAVVQAHQANVKGASQSRKASEDMGNAASTAGGKVKRASDEASEGMRRMGQEAEKGKESFFKAVLGAELLTRAVFGLKDAVKSFTTEAAFVAARVEVMGTVVANMGRVNNLTSTTLATVEAKIKSLGITTSESRQTIASFIQANLDLTKAAQLARVAQDAAVIGNVSSAEALQRLTHGIVTLQPEILRTIGITVNFEQEYNKFAKATGRTTESISQQEKQAIALNAVLTQGQRLAGIYEAAMGDVGKQMSSLKRYSEEAQAAVGKQFLATLSAGVVTLTEFLKIIAEYPGVITAVATAVTMLTVAMIALNTTWAVTAVTKFIGSLQVLIGVMTGTASAAAGMGATITGMALGWGAVLVIIGAVVAAFWNLDSAIEAGLKASDANIAKSSETIQALRRSREATEEMVGATKLNEKQHEELGKAMEGLAPIQRNLINDLIKQKDGTDELTGAIKALNAEIDKRQKAEQGKLEIQLVPVVRGMADAWQDVVDAQAEAAKFQEIYNRGKAELAQFPGDPVLTQGLQVAEKSFNRADAAAAKAQKTFDELKNKFFVAGGDLGLFNQRLIEFAVRAGVSQKAAEALAKEIERLVQRPENLYPPPMKNPAEDPAEKARLAEEARRIQEFREQTSEAIRALRNKELTGLEAELEKIDLAYRKILKSHLELGKPEQKKIRGISKADAVAAQAAWLEAREDAFDKERQRWQKVVDDEQDYFIHQVEKTNKIMDQLTEKRLRDTADASLEDLKRQFEAEDKIKQVGIERDIALADTEAEKEILRNKQRLDEYAKTIEGLYLKDENYYAMRDALDALSAAKITERSRERAKQLVEENDQLAAELAYDVRSPFINQDAMKFQGRLAVELVRQQQELNKAKEAQATTEELIALEQNHQLRLQKLYREEYDRLFDEIEENAGRVFDDMLTSGKNVFASLGNFIKSIFLTELRREFARTVASLLTPLFAGLRGLNPAAQGAGQGGGTSWKNIFTLGQTAAGDLGDFGPGGKYGNSFLPWKVGTTGQAQGAVDQAAAKIGQEVGKKMDTGVQAAAAARSEAMLGQISSQQYVHTGALGRIEGWLSQILNAILALAARPIVCNCQGGGGGLLGNIGKAILGGLGPVAAPATAAAAAGAAAPATATTVSMMSELGPVGGVAAIGGGAGAVAGAAGAASAIPAGAAAGSLALPLTAPSLGAAAFVPGLTTPGVTGLGATGAAGGWASTHGLFGMPLAKIGAFLANPITLAVAGAIIAGIAIYKFFRHRQEKKFREEIMRDFGIVVDDMKVLETIVKIGKSMFGDGYKNKRFEVIRSDQVQGLLINYAMKTGQDPSKLPLYQKFYGKGFTQEPLTLEQSKIDAGSEETAAYIQSQTKVKPTNLYSASTPPPQRFQHGGLVRGVDTGRDTILALLRGNEEVLSPEQRVEAKRKIMALQRMAERRGWAGGGSLATIIQRLIDKIEKLAQAQTEPPSVVVHNAISLDPKATQTLMEKGYVKATVKNPRAIARSTAKALESDYKRRAFVEAL